MFQKTVWNRGPDRRCTLKTSTNFRTENLFVLHQQSVSEANLSSFTKCVERTEFYTREPFSFIKCEKRKFTASRMVCAKSYGHCDMHAHKMVSSQFTPRFDRRLRTFERFIFPCFTR